MCHNYLLNNLIALLTGRHVYLCISGRTLPKHVATPYSVFFFKASKEWFFDLGVRLIGPTARQDSSFYIFTTNS